jgi:hypothetical protein
MSWTTVKRTLTQVQQHLIGSSPLAYNKKSRQNTYVWIALLGVRKCLSEEDLNISAGATAIAVLLTLCLFYRCTFNSVWVVWGGG